MPAAAPTRSGRRRLILSERQVGDVQLRHVGRDRRFWASQIASLIDSDEAATASVPISVIWAWGPLVLQNLHTGRISQYTLVEPDQHERSRDGGHLYAGWTCSAGSGRQPLAVHIQRYGRCRGPSTATTAIPAGSGARTRPIPVLSTTGCTATTACSGCRVPRTGGR